MWTYHHFTHHLCIHNSPCFYLLSGVCEGTWQLCSLCPQLDRSHLFHHSNRWHKTFDKHCCMYLLIDNLDQKIFSSLLFLNTSKNSYTIKRKTRSTTIRVTSMRSVFIGPIYCEIHKKNKKCSQNIALCWKLPYHSLKMCRGMPCYSMRSRGPPHHSRKTGYLNIKS